MHQSAYSRTTFYRLEIVIDPKRTFSGVEIGSNVIIIDDDIWLIF